MPNPVYSLQLTVNSLKKFFAASINRQQSTVNFKATPGFTLIELLTVITIIGILVTITVASYSTAQTKGRDSKRKQDLDTIKKALELAKIDSAGQYYYPVCESGLDNCALSDTNTTPDLSPTYAPKIPTDPKDKTGYYYATKNSTGTACNSSSGCTSYELWACLENKNDPQGITATGCTITQLGYRITPN